MTEHSYETIRAAADKAIAELSEIPDQMTKMLAFGFSPDNMQAYSPADLIAELRDLTPVGLAFAQKHLEDDEEDMLPPKRKFSKWQMLGIVVVCVVTFYLFYRF